jgi:hypothetical protein
MNVAILPQLQAFLRRRAASHRGVTARSALKNGETVPVSPDGHREVVGHVQPR